MNRWNLTAFVLMACASAGFDAVADTVRGTVFNDLNGNGVLDAGEPGIPQVGVSNGVDVVATDGEGFYTLEVGGDAEIFVIKPSHWRTALDPATKLPRNFYVHRPDGSPETKYPGVVPTGPLPDALNFPLTAQPEEEPFTVLCFGDTQPRNQQEVDFISHDVLEELIGTKAAFGMTLGDLSFDNLDMLPQIAQSVGTLGIPWYHVIGNHDINYDTPDFARQAETYTRVFGPQYYSFNHGKVHFLVLNDIHWDVENKEYHGEFGADQLAFIEQDLALVPKDYLIVPLMHIPLQSVVDRDKLFALLKPYRHTFSISAHWHRQSHFYMGAEEGWHGEGEHHHLVQGTSCGAWWTGVFDELGIPHTTMSDGTPNGYALITFDGADYKVRYQASRRRPDYQMNIWAPEMVASAAAPASEVVVNFFSGSERSTVRMRVADGAWISMTQFNGIDPYVAANKERERELARLLAKAEGLAAPSDQEARKSYNAQSAIVGRTQPDPRETDHLWKAALPAGLAAGYQVIEVECTDGFGVVHVGRRIIRVDVGG